MKLWDVLLIGGVSAMRSSGNQKELMRFNSFAESIENLHVPGKHWRLSPVAVLPEKQRTGVGRALLEHRLDLIGNASCVLETQSRSNEMFYQKFGFETMHRTKVPGTTLEHILMLRKIR